MIVHAPVRFAGSDEERRANQATHRYYYSGGPDDADVRCDNCDCRPSHAAASYPCGVSVPRETITVERIPA